MFLPKVPSMKLLTKESKCFLEEVKPRRHCRLILIFVKILFQWFYLFLFLKAGYFENQFKRIMEKEAYTDPVKIRRQERLKEGKKNLGKAFLPNNGEKLP